MDQGISFFIYQLLMYSCFYVVESVILFDFIRLVRENSLVFHGSWSSTAELKLPTNLLPLTVGSGARFSRVPKTFRAQKAIRKTTTCLFCKAGLFIRCKGNKNQNNCKVSCLETPSFEDTKRIMAPEIRPKSFGTFEKQAPDQKI